MDSEDKRYREKVLRELDALLSNIWRTDERIRSAVLAKAQIEVDQQIREARAVGRSPFEVESERVAAVNEEIKRRRAIELDGYQIDADEFIGKFGLFLSSISFMPDLAARTLSGDVVGEAVYEATVTDLRRSRDARSRLIGVCDAMAVSEFARVLRKNYETLQRSLVLGNSEVNAIRTRGLCMECEKLADRYLSVETLVKLYDLGNPPFPHEVHWRDEPQWCPGPTLMFAVNDRFGLR